MNARKPEDLDELFLLVFFIALCILLWRTSH